MDCLFKLTIESDAGKPDSHDTTLHCFANMQPVLTSVNLQSTHHCHCSCDANACRGHVVVDPPGIPGRV